MIEKLELQPDEPLSVKVERHRAAYLAVLSGMGGADMDQEAEARMEIIRHAPSYPDERDQKLLYVAGYLIASEGNLALRKWSFFFQAPPHCPGIDDKQASGPEISSWWQPIRRMQTWQIQ